MTTPDPIRYLTEDRKLDAESVELLKQALHYDPETGILAWRVRPETHFPDFRSFRSWNSRYAGKPAGTVNGKSGHLAVTVNNRRFLSHRAAWAIFYGEFPQGEIDHINGNPSDNRIVNLRDVSHAENMRNQKPRENYSGVSGVSWHKAKSRWCAALYVGGRKRTVGYFRDINAAELAVKAARISHGYHENHGAQNRV